MRNGVGCLILLVSICDVSSADSISRTLTFADLKYEFTSVRVEEDSGGVRSVLTALGRLATGSDLAGFDEALYGTLVQVDLSFDYRVPTRVFGRIDAGSTGAVSADVSYDERLFVRGFPPSGPAAVLVNEFVASSVDSASHVQTTTDGGFTLIDGALGPTSPYRYSFTGADVQFFLGNHGFGAIFELELTNAVSTASSYGVGGLLKPQSSPSFDGTAAFTITYTFQTTAPAVPEPGGIALVGVAVLGFGVYRGRRRRAAA